MTIIEMEKETPNIDKIGIVGIVDGDPYDRHTWSGSSFFFFEALKRHGCLTAAISGYPKNIVNRIYQLRNFHWSIKKWKFKYHIDTAHYEAMTSKTRKELLKLDLNYTHVLQICCYYDVPSIVRSKNVIKCAYQDGNLMCLLRSAFGAPNVSSYLIKKALEWENNVYRNLDIIFTFSEWLRRSFINDFGVDPNKVYAVGAGANLPLIRTTGDKDHERKTVLFIGIDFERKGGRVLLEAFKQVRAEIPDARLIIIGPDLKDLPDGVECMGFISKSNPKGLKMIARAYMEASIFVMPSLYEPFGIAFIEAMAHRLPCIGTDSCAIPEIIDAEETGYLVPAGESEPLARRIIELLKTPELMDRMGNMGYKKFTENYTWDYVTSRMLNILLKYM